MPLVVTSVPNLAQGVSQQPDNLRYPGQCDEQINAWATVVEGLVKRPNTRWINEFNSGATPTNLFTHFVKRDEQNKYCVTVSLGSSVPTVGVIDLTSGTNISVATTSIANSYLTGITNPLADLRALTVADYTFLVNKKKTVAKSTVKTKDLEREALITVKLGDYDKYYNVYIDGIIIPYTNAWSGHSSDHDVGSTIATYKSGNGSGASNTNADTSHIASDLADLIELRYSTTTNGISAINVSQAGSGYVMPTHPADPIIDYDLYKVEVEVIQRDSLGNIQGKGARGECVISQGEIESVTITHSGSGYDSSYQTPEVIIKELAWSDEFDQWDQVNGLHSGQVAVLTATISQFDPIQVEQDGSVIKLSRVSYVINDEVYYRCIQNHTSDANKEPGTGADWQEYWEIVEETTLANAWALSTSYTVGTDFAVRVSDGLSDEGLQVVYKEVDSITDLPKKCYDRFRVKVRGDADIDQDDYYVIFKTKDNENYGEGSWVETVGWYQDKSKANLVEGIEYVIDRTTMPITLVPVFTGDDVTSFKLQTPEEDKEIKTDEEKGWRKRDSGDDNTNPFPSFVGSKINDVFFFKNRLGFLTDSNVIFSEADEYFNFFRTTTQQLLDSAPIDVGLSHTKVAVLQHALPFQEKLMLFSDNSQFVLRGADVLSPKTVAISPVTEYDISDGIAPLALGPYIYFPFKRGQFEGMFEYFVDNNTEVFEAEEITSQVPKYIPSKIKQMAGSAAESMVLLQNATDAKTLYVYKYFWSGKEKIQSAWQKWTFDDDVTGFDFIDSTLYLILNGKVLVEMPVENAITDTGLDYTLLLDNRVDGARDEEAPINFPDLLVNYDESTNRTTISNLPDGYGVVVTLDNEGKVTYTNTTVFTKGGSERKLVGSSSGTSVEIEGFIASYVDNGGAYVQYDGEYYYCIKTHTSASTFESQYWRKAVYPPEGTPAWSSSVTYFEGTIYRCQTNHTSPDTFAVGTRWQSTTEVPSAPEWGPNIFYNNRYYFVVGKPYDMLYRFSNQALKQPTERGGRSASDYTYQTIRNASIEYADTGHFTVEVTSRFRDTYSYVYNPALLSSISTLDRFTPESGHFRFGVQCRPDEATIEVKSSSALPVKLLAAEFESMVTGRSKRYGA